MNFLYHLEGIDKLGCNVYAYLSYSLDLYFLYHSSQLFKHSYY